MSFKENLRDEIAYQGLQLKEVAAKAGLTYPSFLPYVNKRAMLPSVEIGVKIAKALNVSVEYLVTGEKSKEDEKYSAIRETIDELLILPQEILKPIKVMIHAAAEEEKKKKKRKVSGD